MVRHQAVGMDVAALLASQPSKVVKEKAAILVFAKASRAIVAPLYGVNGNAWNYDASASGHPQVNVAVEPPLTGKRGLSLIYSRAKR